MVLSDYIKELEEIISIHGDMDIVTFIESEDWESLNEGEYVSYSADPLNDSVKTVCTYISNESGKVYASTNDKGYIDCKIEKVFEINKEYF